MSKKKEQTDKQENKKKEQEELRKRKFEERKEEAAMRKKDRTQLNNQILQELNVDINRYIKCLLNSTHLVLYKTI